MFFVGNMNLTRRNQIQLLNLRKHLLHLLVKEIMLYDK